MSETNPNLRLDQIRREYRALVEARNFEEAVSLFEEVGSLYHAISKRSGRAPAHFLPQSDPLM